MESRSPEVAALCWHRSGEAKYVLCLVIPAVGVRDSREYEAHDSEAQRRSSRISRPFRRPDVDSGT